MILDIPANILIEIREDTPTCNYILRLIYFSYEVTYISKTMNVAAKLG